jgi:hypothetical protein
MRPGDTVFVRSAEPEYLWAAHATPATRWVFDYPLIVVPEDYAPEVRHDLCAHPPRFVVLPVGKPLAPLPIYRCVTGYAPVARSGAAVLLERPAGG